MNNYQSEFMREFVQRGYFYQATAPSAFDSLASKSIIPAYIGFDATADSLHVGSLMQIMVLRLLQKQGHKPIVLMGGGTSLVGDPSGKDEARKMLSPQDIEANIAQIQKIFNRFLRFGDGDSDAVLVSNAEWLCDLNYIAVLRDIGRHFSVGRMLGFDSVKSRLDREQPLSFLEFNYMVLQAYDFLELYRRFGCLLQIGGADQWGNIVCGIDLARRTAHAQLYGLTTPLLATASGAKMGKTAAGAVWLSAHRLSAYDYWQFWRNSEDADVVRFLWLFTELPPSEIEKLASLSGSDINVAKIALADAATALCHGESAQIQASEAAHAVFSDGGTADDLPRLILSQAEVDAGVGLLLVLQNLGFTASNGEGRRLVQQHAVKLNDNVVGDAATKITSADFSSDIAAIGLKISVGKKKHGLVKLEHS